MKTAKDNTRMNMPPVVSLPVFLVIIAVVHFFYQGVVIPNAQAAIAAQGAGGTVSIWVILKDLEQQICISIGLFCLVIMGYKYYRIVFIEEPLFTTDYLQSYDKSQPLDVDQAINDLQQSSHAKNSSVATWINCLRRYKNTNNVQHAADATRDSVDALAVQLEAGNALIRYFIWAIPSIGFIGTVRGIGSALAKAEEAVSGDISGMVDMLGVAFNSTLVALVISIILMYVLHVLNNRQDEMVIKTRENCETHLLTQLHR
ncbi:MotA/TolQ/ExbB proton channel family protein [Idiomarina xiamenensis]|uniref:Biopolymer ExbB family transporter n=1 Tax=Idiomarina xiamenensis 10-D-4 TaxID=740709 RepID=K2JBL3_9GAMM|nr:MotA/TolQ/ExbB proton channel family protein [Idiomarina xiamenensis]EKE80636.1 biopolymer ExbB family transporter [Idiomarina xiamenensis 10-D-4]